MQVTLTVKDETGRKVISIASVAGDFRGVAAILYGAARSIDGSVAAINNLDDGKLHGRAIADAAVSVMSGSPDMTYWRPKQLLAAVQARGVVAGVDPEATLITSIHRDPRIQVVSKGCYALAQVAA